MRAAHRVALALVFALICLGPSLAHAAEHGTLDLTTSSGVHHFKIETATTPAERAVGLMFRKHMDADTGMLFLYDTPRPIEMWMKNTFIPLDMVFIGKDWRVSHITTWTEPFSLTTISSDGPVLGVVELNAGTADDIGLAIGDKITYTPETAKAPAAE